MASGLKCECGAELELNDAFCRSCGKKKSFKVDPRLTDEAWVEWRKYQDENGLSDATDSDLGENNASRTGPSVASIEKPTKESLKEVKREFRDRNAPKKDVFKAAQTRRRVKRLIKRLVLLSVASAVVFVGFKTFPNWANKISSLTPAIESVISEGSQILGETQGVTEKIFTAGECLSDPKEGAWDATIVDNPSTYLADVFSETKSEAEETGYMEFRAGADLTPRDASEDPEFDNIETSILVIKPNTPYSSYSWITYDTLNQSNYDEPKIDSFYENMGIGVIKQDANGIFYSVYGDGSDDSTTYSVGVRDGLVRTMCIESAIFQERTTTKFKVDDLGSRIVSSQVNSDESVYLVPKDEKIGASEILDSELQRLSQNYDGTEFYDVKETFPLELDVDTLIATDTCLIAFPYDEADKPQIISALSQYRSFPMSEGKGFIAFGYCDAIEQNYDVTKSYVKRSQAELPQ